MFNKFAFSTFQPTIFVFNRGIIQGFKANVFVEDLTNNFVVFGRTQVQIAVSIPAVLGF